MVRVRSRPKHSSICGVRALATNVLAMRYNVLGKTGLYVSELCLGTMTFGGKGFWCGSIAAV
jgi:hypothetical protein